MVTVVQPYLYKPLPVDVQTAIKRIVDHYLVDEEDHYWNWPETEKGNSEHMFLWLTVLNRWMQQEGQDSNKRRSQFVPLPLPVLETMTQVLWHLRNCDLNDLCPIGAVTSKQAM